MIGVAIRKRSLWGDWTGSVIAWSDSHIKTCTFSSEIGLVGVLVRNRFGRCVGSQVVVSSFFFVFRRARASIRLRRGSRNVVFNYRASL